MAARSAHANFLRMYSGYAAIWSAKLVSLPPTQVTVVPPVNVMLRLVYNTLDGIVNDYFVITASVAAR
ncbi:MAG TPA: hypothetical protein VIA63_07140 [Candidatus Limnocylindria bacterium]